MTTTQLIRQTRARLSWLDRLALPPAFIVAALIFIIAGGISALGQLRSQITAAAVPTPSLPIILIATPKPAPPPTLPTVQVAAAAPVRYVTAWAAPDGAVLGPIPAPSLGDVLARYGEAWVMIQWQGSPVWLRASDLGLPAVADLAPPPQPEVVYVSAPAPAYAPPTMPPAIEPPPPQPETRQQAIQDRLRANEQHGGSGKMAAPVFEPMDSNATWCAAAAAAGHARCVEP